MQVENIFSIQGGCEFGSSTPTFLARLTLLFRTPLSRLSVSESPSKSISCLTDNNNLLLFNSLDVRKLWGYLAGDFPEPAQNHFPISKLWTSQVTKIPEQTELGIESEEIAEFLKIG